MRRSFTGVSSRATSRLLARSRVLALSLPTGTCFFWLVMALALPANAAEMANLRNGFSIRHEHHEVVGNTTRLYMSTDPAGGYVDVPTADIENFEPAPPDPSDVTAKPAGPMDLKSIVSAASNLHQIDADFIASVIHAESANNPRAVSPKGAQGLMQLMPGTAGKLGVKDSFDPADNVDGGVRYLRELLSALQQRYGRRRWPPTTPARSGCSNITACRPIAKPAPTWLASSPTTTARSWPSASSKVKPTGLNLPQRLREKVTLTANESSSAIRRPIARLTSPPRSFTLTLRPRGRFGLILLHE